MRNTQGFPPDPKPFIKHLFKSIVQVQLYFLREELNTRIGNQWVIHIYPVIVCLPCLHMILHEESVKLNLIIWTGPRKNLANKYGATPRRNSGLNTTRECAYSFRKIEFPRFVQKE